jgi:RNase P protein component
VDEVSLKIHAVEEERYRCEVRQVLRWRSEDREKAMEFLTNVRKRRGDITAEKLAKDCKEQWSKGNRGIKGDWRE